MAKNPTPPTSTTPKKVTPEDLRAKFAALQGEVESTADQAKGVAVTVGAVVGAVVLVGVFAFGLRRGKKRTTVVEIRRV